MKSEFKKDAWWSHYKCPKCKVLCSSQNWGAGMYRIVCETCGHTLISLLPFGDEDSSGTDAMK